MQFQFLKQCRLLALVPLGLLILALALLAAPGGGGDPADVQVTGFTDYGFGTWSSGDAAISDDLCVYKSTGTNRYYVTATGSGSGGALTVSGSGATLDYSVGWRVGTSGNFTNLTAGTQKRFSGADLTSTTCSGVDNSSMEISFSSNDLEAAAPADYTGTVTITVEPA